MNRIKLGFLAESASSLVDEWAADTDGAEGANGDMAIHESPRPYAIGNKSRHSVFLPVHMENRYRYPLLIWLHGDGEDTGQLSDVMPRISDRNFIGVSIQGTRQSVDGGFTWSQTPSAIESTSRRIQHAIRSVRKSYNIDIRRVFIAGPDRGGTMAFRIAFRLSHLFLGAASLNGAVPSNLQPMLNLRQSREVPLFWGHRRNSDALPESILCEQLKLLYVAGFDVTLRQYPGEDVLADPACSDLNKWMMERIAGQQKSNIIL
jgi:phospholipase/carboxylesterase